MSFADFKDVYPSSFVTGIDEDKDRIRKSCTGNWVESIEHPNEQCLIERGKIAKLSKESVMYIWNQMAVSMNRSCFKEPNGIHKTMNGFLMGDTSAARGSKIILQIFELKIF